MAKPPGTVDRLGEYVVALPNWMEWLEMRAQKNHSQSLAELKKRGGLSPCEAIALFEDRRWRRMSNTELSAAFERYEGIV